MAKKRILILPIAIISILVGCNTKVDTQVKSLTTKLEHIDLHGAQKSHDVCVLYSYYYTAKNLHELLPERIRLFGPSKAKIAGIRKAAAQTFAEELSRRIKAKETSFDCLEQWLEVSTLYGVSKTLEALIVKESLDTEKSVTASQTPLATAQERREALVASAKKQVPQLFLQWQLFYDGEWCSQAKRLLSFVEEDHIPVSKLGIMEDTYKDLKIAKAKAKAKAPPKKR